MALIVANSPELRHLVPARVCPVACIPEMVGPGMLREQAREGAPGKARGAMMAGSNLLIVVAGAGWAAETEEGV